jgi:hypothetical protein
VLAWLQSLSTGGAEQDDRSLKAPHSQHDRKDWFECETLNCAPSPRPLSCTHTPEVRYDDVRSDSGVFVHVTRTPRRARGSSHDQAKASSEAKAKGVEHLELSALAAAVGVVGAVAAADRSYNPFTIQRGLYYCNNEKPEGQAKILRAKDTYMSEEGQERGNKHMEHKGANAFARGMTISITTCEGGGITLIDLAYNPMPKPELLAGAPVTPSRASVC